MDRCERDPSVRALRASLLCWYPFPAGERALLIGEDTEALLPLLKAHYSRVDEAPDEAEACYDLIAAIGSAERAEDPEGLLRALCRALKQDGVLLLGFRNRFGLRYFCGGVDELVTTPFAAIRRDGVRLFARREMERLLHGAGFPGVRFYYPVPDADFVQAVYTDEALPEGGFHGRVFPFDRFCSPLLAGEGALCDDLAREGALPFTANYYLAECRRDPARADTPRLLSAVLSVDRGESHGFVTTIYADRVLKAPIAQAGRASLEEQLRNLQALKSRGLLTVPADLGEQGLAMPRIREEAALDWLRRMLREDPASFVRFFDRLRDDLLRASDPAALAEADARRDWGVSPEALGPVLETGYPDMVPFNIFVSEQGLRYYDQEFALSPCPLGYILFRALRYTWEHLPEAESIVPLETMKERFALTAAWDAYQNHEDAFVRENRQTDRYRQIYDWAQADSAAIRARCVRLLDEDPAAAEDRLLSRVHRVQLGLLREFDRVCRENGLRYLAVHGTLLGAARHGGFIPWDDDLDLAMPREDYDRLLEMADRVFREPFFLQSPRSEPLCFYGGYSKLRDSRSTARDRANRWRNVNQGIWIDILPLDFCPEDPRRLQRLQRKILTCQRLIYAKLYPLEDLPQTGLNGKNVSASYLAAGCMRLRWLYRRLDRLCRSCPPGEMRAILACCYGTRENRNVYFERELRETAALGFEDMRLPVPADYDAVLRRRYGDDYMTLPPRQRRYRHSEIEFDTERSFREHGET